MNKVEIKSLNFISLDLCTEVYQLPVVNAWPTATLPTDREYGRCVCVIHRHMYTCVAKAQPSCWPSLDFQSTDRESYWN